MSAFERLLSSLDSHGERVTGNGRHRMATCPGHEDRNPSLSVTQDGDRVLVNCQAGCDTEDVLTALGLTMADLFDEARQNGHGRREVAAYDYTDEVGRLLFQVVRYEPKGFRQRRPDGAGGWLWQLDGVRRVLYRLSAVQAAVESGQPVYIVEGEKDVHSAERAGVVATTNAGGADKWRPEYTATLKGADVTVVADRDGAGHRHAADVARALRGVAASVRVLEPVPGCKDLTVHLAAGRTLDELVAADGDPDGEGQPVGRFLHWPTFWATDRDELDWLVEPLVAVGQAISNYSPAKVGKSLLWLEVAAALATGRPVLANPAREPMHVVYVDHEQSADDLAERLSSLGYGPHVDLSRLHYSLLADWPPLDTAEGGAVLHAAATGYGARLVILDTISRAISGGENDADTFLALYRHTVRQLKRDRIAFVRLDHSGKDLSRGQRGSSAKSADVDTVWQLLARGEDTLTLRREASRSGYGPPLLWLRREVGPLRHVIDSADAAHEREVERIVEQLDELDVSLDEGRVKASDALHAAGIKVRTARLAEAIKRRRLREDGAEDALFPRADAGGEPSGKAG